MDVLKHAFALSERIRAKSTPLCLQFIYEQALTNSLATHTCIYIYMKQPLKNPYGTIYSSKKFTVHSQTNLISHHGANLLIFSRIMLVYSVMYFYLGF